MRKEFYIVRLLKINKNTYSIVLMKNTFFEVLGSYTSKKGFRNFEIVFLNKDRLFFWLSKGAGCEIPAYRFLKLFLLGK
jgi:ribosomal protein S16